MEAALEESACGIDSGLKVHCQPAIASDPGEDALNHPAPRVNGEADLIRVLAHDFDREESRRFELLNPVRNGLLVYVNPAKPVVDSCLQRQKAGYRRCR